MEDPVGEGAVADTAPAPEGAGAVGGECVVHGFVVDAVAAEAVGRIEDGTEGDVAVGEEGGAGGGVEGVVPVGESTGVVAECLERVLVFGEKDAVPGEEDALFCQCLLDLGMVGGRGVYR